MFINRKHKSVAICFIYLAVLLLPGFIFPQSKWLQGYQKTISGGTIDYHSPQPDVTSALLVRSLDSNNFISWESQAIPKNFQGDFATFIWIFGMDVDSDPHKYELSINNRTWFRFANPTSSSVNNWIVYGPGGSELRFRVTSIDRHNDVFGYASMTVPVTLVPAGKPLTIKVTGESAGSRVWYMTFQAPVNAGINIVPQQALLRKNGALKQPVEVQIIHLGSPVKASLSAPGIKKVETKLRYGFNRIPLLFPEISKSINVPISIHVRDQKPVTKNLNLSPVIKWHVFLVQNTHTDIGYTRPQSEILPDHLRFIDYALDYCDQTDTYPDDSRFNLLTE